MARNIWFSTKERLVFHDGWGETKFLMSRGYIRFYFLPVFQISKYRYHFKGQAQVSLAQWWNNQRQVFNYLIVGMFKHCYGISVISISIFRMVAPIEAIRFVGITNSKLDLHHKWSFFRKTRTSVMRRKVVINFSRHETVKTKLPQWEHN